jgi:hypothetical protein
MASADLVVFPTGNRAWTVTVTPYEDPNDPSPTPPAPPLASQAFKIPTRIEVTEVDGTKRIRITWADGKTSEQWMLPKLAVIFGEDPRNGQVMANQPGSMASVGEKSVLVYGSDAFGWMTTTNLVEKEPISYKSKQCFHYLTAGNNISPAPKDFQREGLGINGVSSTPVREAWIDAKTLMPVALHIGPNLYTFAFAAEPPTGPLTMPDKFQKEVKFYTDLMGPG